MWKVVYYISTRQSLEILINLEQRSCLKYFFSLIKKDIETVPVELRQISSIASQLGSDNKVSMRTGSYTAQLIDKINLSGNDRVRALIIMVCISDKIKIDIEYSTAINVMDMI